MRISGRYIKNQSEYAVLYAGIHFRARSFAAIAVCLWGAEVWVNTSLLQADGWTIFGMSIGFVLRCIAFMCFMMPWHDESVKASEGIFPFWLGIIDIILVCINWLSCVSALVSLAFAYLETGAWILLVYIAIASASFIFLPIVFYYFIQWLRIYRWTWDELQLPVQERKRIYREKKRIRREEKRAARHNYVQEKMKTAKEIFHRSNNEKPIKSQTDRRAELENLKKLYEDGLIDEEEYKKAREKALDIK